MLCIPAAVLLCKQDSDGAEKQEALEVQIKPIFHEK